MRDYSKASGRFWTGDTGKQLRGQADPQRVAFYLFTCPSSNMIGLYYLPLPTLIHEIGIPLQGALKALRRVSEVGFAHYDPPSEYVWVPEMACQQVAETLKVDDNRVKGIINELEKHRKSPFFNQFLKRYNDPFHLKMPPAPESPSEGAPKGLRSQEQEQEQEQDIEQEQEKEGEGNAASPPSASLLNLGEFGQVQLTPEQFQKLRDRLNGSMDRLIDDLDRYSQTHPAKFKKYSNHYAVILQWHYRDVKEGKTRGEQRSGNNTNSGASGSRKLNLTYTPKKRD